MRIEFLERSGDFDGPCLDISANTQKEAFELGKLFNKIAERQRCCWDCSGSEIFRAKIRIPLMKMKPSGLVDEEL